MKKQYKHVGMESNRGEEMGGIEGDKKNRDGRNLGGFMEENEMPSRKKGGDRSDDKYGSEKMSGQYRGPEYGPLRSHENKHEHQHHQTPIGHEEALSHAKRTSDHEASPAPNGEHSGNRGHADAMSAASTMAGPSPSTEYGDDKIYESDLRAKAGEAVSEMAMHRKHGEMPLPASKASGYRITSEAIPADKAKMESGEGEY